MLSTWNSCWSNVKHRSVSYVKHMNKVIMWKRCGNTWLLCAISHVKRMNRGSTWKRCVNSISFRDILHVKHIKGMPMWKWCVINGEIYSCIFDNHTWNTWIVYTSGKCVEVMWKPFPSRGISYMKHMKRIHMWKFNVNSRNITRETHKRLHMRNWCVNPFLYFRYITRETHE